MLKNNLSPY